MSTSNRDRTTTTAAPSGGGDVHWPKKCGRPQMLLMVVLAVVLLPAAHGLRCDRTPEGAQSQGRKTADGRFYIEVSGNPETYVPGEQYTIFLRGVTDYTSQHKFKDFLLLVEHEVSEKPAVGGPPPDPYQSPSVGSLQLYGDMLTKFSEKCRNAVIQTNSLPKSEVQVLWLAPAAGSGCVAISATIVESRDKWYSGDGALSKVLCEELQESEDIQPNVMRQCCACDEAKYEVTFEGLWSRNTHPKDFPSNGWLTRFSDIIGASHTVDYTFWNYGEIASEGLRQLAENGNTRMLESELKAKSEHIRTIIKARGISYPNITGRTFAVFRVDSRHHLMSLVSMLDPSPDWIVGVSSLELCLRNCTWVESRVLNLYPWDAGTDDGATYISPNQPLNPRHPIRRIKSNSPNDPRSPFYDPTGAEMKPLARLYLTRQRLYEKNCETSSANLNEYNSGGGGGGEEPDGNPTPGCEVDEWSDWSPCSATCGKGVKYKQRSYKNDDSKYNCRVVLTRRAVCYAHMRYCRTQTHAQEEEDPRCALTEWGEWSGCSATCGRGWKTKSRRYKNRSAAKRCAAVNENAPPLEQNMECIGSERNCEVNQQLVELERQCEDRAWSSWSPCSATCGKGIKIRRKLPEAPRFSFVRSRNARNHLDEDEERSDDDDDEDEEEDDGSDPCVALEERVECLHDDRPICAEMPGEESAASCTLPKDVGLCRSNVDRWYFDFIRGECDIFSYSGCQGNANNYKTLEQCQRICDEYKKELIANRTLQKAKLGATISGVLSYNIQNDGNQEHCGETYFNGIKPGSQTVDRANKEYYGNLIDERPTGEVIDCLMTPWSAWTSCNTTCGKGFKSKHRTIKAHPRNGGKRCPEKLLKKRKCRVACPGDRDYTLMNESPSSSYKDVFRYGTPSWGSPSGSQSHPVVESIPDVDCIMARWSAWSPCSRSCGPYAVQQRTRSIVQAASGGGMRCFHRTEERPCALLACPE